jgi:hypothetical protein
MRQRARGATAVSALRLLVSPPPSSLSLPATAQSSRHAVTYAFCREKRMGRQDAKATQFNRRQIRFMTKLPPLLTLSVAENAPDDNMLNDAMQATTKMDLWKASPTPPAIGHLCVTHRSGRPSSIKASPSLSPPSSPWSTIATSQSPVPTDACDFCRQKRARRQIGSRHNSTAHDCNPALPGGGVHPGTRHPT